MIYIYIIKYYSAVGENENLPFATIIDGPRGYYASERSQRKANTAYYHLHVESKK